MATFTGSNSAEILPDLIIGPVQGIGNDFVDALGGDDVAIGWSGDDVIRGGAGADVIIGGLLNAAGIITLSGIDAADYTTSVDGVTIDLSVLVSLTLPVLGVNIQLTGASQGFGGDAQGDYLVGIVNLIGSNTGGDNLTGSAAANTINGQGGNDILNGEGGNDILLGGAGDDVLIGGGGADSLQGGAGSRDTADYSGSAAQVTVNLTTGVGSGSDAQGDTLTGIERLIGSAGNDTLTGSAGNDILMGGAGADTLTGGGGIDTAEYSSSSAAVTVNLASGDVSGGDAEGDTLNGITNLIGSEHNDVLTGSTLGNSLAGGAGDDTLVGGAGADNLDGGDGVDTADYSDSTDAVTIGLAAGINSGGDAAGDTLTGIENVRGSSSGDDTLTGDAGANRLTGLGGDDVLEGGGGDDTIEGSDGDGDVAVFSGNLADYQITFSAGAYTVTDTRDGSPDGVDTLTGIELLRFLDGDISPEDTQQPALNDVSPTVAFAENTVNATPQLLDADVSFTAPPGKSFDGGTIVVTGLLAEDVVSIRNEGTAAGQIGLAGTSVTFGNVEIGTASGGTGGDFTVTFNAGATAEAIDALIQNLTYQNSSNTPTANRDLSITVTDADDMTASATISVAVTAENDAPTTPVDSDAADDAVAEDAAIGATVGIAASSTDVETPGSITYALTDDAGGRFAIDATTGVVTVAAALDFETTTSHTITVTATDGDSAASTAANFVIAVGNVNEASALTGLGPAVTATEQTVVTLDAGVAVSDPELDSLGNGLGNYAGASLTVSRQGGANPQDEFAVVDGSGFTVAGTEIFDENGRRIADFSSSGGTLTINFTSQQAPATSALVDAIISSITYRNAADNPPASLVLDYVFEDGGQNQGSGGSKTANGQLTVDITPVNDAPVGTATGDLADGRTGRDYTIRESVLLQGFSDPDGDVLHVQNLTASHGTLTDNGDGTWTLTPSRLFTGSVTLTYEVSDGAAAPLAATQSFQIADPSGSGGDGGEEPPVVVIEGTPGVDNLPGTDGDDVLAPLEGDDDVFGGDGDDSVILPGDADGYVFVQLANGKVGVVDIDPSDGDQGSDVLDGIELIRFGDENAVDTPLAGLIDMDQPDWTLKPFEVELVAATWQLFMQMVPSGGGFEYLIDSPDNPTDLGDAYFASFNAENKYLSFASNLATEIPAGMAWFDREFGGLTFEQAIDKAFDLIITDEALEAAGGDPEASKAFFLAAEDFYETVAVQRIVRDGVTFDDAVKIALVSSVLYEAVKADVGPYAEAVGDFAEHVARVGYSNDFLGSLLEAA